MYKFTYFYLALSLINKRNLEVNISDFLKIHFKTLQCAIKMVVVGSFQDCLVYGYIHIYWLYWVNNHLTSDSGWLHGISDLLTVISDTPGTVPAIHLYQLSVSHLSLRSVIFLNQWSVIHLSNDQWCTLVNDQGYTWINYKWHTSKWSLVHLSQWSVIDWVSDQWYI